MKTKQPDAEKNEAKPPECNNNWHVFAGGLPKAGERCKCGKRIATAKIGVLVHAAIQ